ncbi:MAG: tetraacyldisaccharide 4'-kinase [Luteibaculum sp.]
MKQFGIATIPLSWLYGGVLRFRHFIYDSGIKNAKTHASVFTVCIGNLSLGGTGKTPLTEYLLSELRFKYKVAVLSRGYGRKTKGFRLVDFNGSADEFGDEPLQVSKKFKDVPFAVCEDRWVGINKLLEYRPDVELVILDDAFQHRNLKSDFNILLTPFHKPFFRDHLVPAGGLRDIKEASLRSDILLITKSPKKVSHETKKVFQRESGFILEKDLFFSHLEYADLYNPETGESLNPKNIDQALIVMGIANPDPLLNYLKGKIDRVKTVLYRDHYRYTEKDIRGLQLLFDNFALNSDRVVITTEKDYVKIEKLKLYWPKNWSVFVAPITTIVNDELGGRFLAIIEEKAKEKVRQNG